ncbi:hypothetical protein BAE44_0012410 [Dichanthelium oligosanthes]|uniref:Uncharacterized protein n=1 Tax=Dichanthelium oligosanthes TaxID=888268 RepID=A0A1E5VNB8_9POAL|nr:hypothetical protein BAE44_0012410 [Dichanthelium oligosanthes]
MLRGQGIAASTDMLLVMSKLLREEDDGTSRATGPSFGEYLSNGWVTSTGPLLLLHALPAAGVTITQQQQLLLLQDGDGITSPTHRMKNMVKDLLFNPIPFWFPHIECKLLVESTSVSSP